MPLKPPMVTLAKSPLMPDRVSISTLSSWLASLMPLTLKATPLPIATPSADSAALFVPAVMDSAVLLPRVTVCAMFKVAGDWSARVPPVTLTLPPRLSLPLALPSRNCNAAAGDDRIAAIGVRPGQDRGTLLDLLHGTAAGNIDGQGERVVAVEGEHAVVDDIAHIEPVVRPFPICKVPAVIVVPPV